MCGPQLKSTDLPGGDLPGGIVKVSSFGKCCAACKKNPACGAFTWAGKRDRRCYLKYSAGWTTRRGATGLTSAVMAGRATRPPPK